MTTEQYPLGKLLWLAVCDTRKVPEDRALLEWQDWDGDFMTKAKWQQAAEKFVNALGVMASEPPACTHCGESEPWTGLCDRMGDLCGKAAAREHASGMEASEPASPEWVDEVRELLDEAYRFQSTSPKAQENINAALELIDQHASGVQGTFHDQPKSPE